MSPPGQAGVAALFAAVVLSINLGQGSILSSDDALYAQMAREMSQGGGWLTAYWLGEAVFEKPPILLWILRCVGPLLGWSDAALRLPGILGASCCVYYGSRFVLSNRKGWLSALSMPIMLLCTVTVCFNARRPMTDILLCASIIASLWYAKGLIDEGGVRSSIRLGVAAGLGVMTKSVAMGPTVMVIGACLLAARRFKETALVFVIALFIVAPWHIAMTVEHGAVFWDVYLGYHIGERISGPLVGSAPWTIYLETLWSLDALIGVALLVGLMTYVVVERGWTPRLIGGTAFLSLVVVHASSTRLYHYFLPVIVLSALASATLVQRSVKLRGLALCVAVIGFLLGPLYPTLLAPDYSPTSRAVALQALEQEPASTRVILWEDYDPALVWYADRPIRIWTADEGFWAVQQSIDMMVRTNAVTFATTEKMNALASDTRRLIIVAPEARAAMLMRWAQQVSAQRAVSIDRTSVDARVIVTLGERT